MKRLVISADGTWNSPKQEGADGRKSTNVLKLLRAVRPSDDQGISQVTFYDKGVGTGGWFDRVTGGAFGVGLSENVLDCYRFLANNHEPGDEIYLFGFSRGAFTVRSLSGLLGAIGLVDKRYLGKLRHGWDYYKTAPMQRDSQKEMLKPLGMRREPVPITCIGVWDTVGSLGIPITWLRAIAAHRFKFHDTQLGEEIRFAFQALAIDERRKPFKPTLWTGSNAERDGVEQVWFAGVHTNIGGGYPRAGLSDIALEWMVDRVAANTDLIFDSEYCKEQINPDPCDKLYDSFGLIYRALGPLVRQIPKGTKIHSSVYARIEATSYKPQNVPMQGFAHGGEQRSVASSQDQ